MSAPEILEELRRMPNRSDANSVETIDWNSVTLTTTHTGAKADSTGVPKMRRIQSRHPLGTGARREAGNG